MAEQSKRDTPFDMAGLMENAFLMGIGVLELTREKTNELADELIERGKMSKSDAKEVADKLGEVAERQQDFVRSTVAKETDRAVKTAGLATREDVEELRAQILELKEMLAAASGVNAESAAETVPEPE